MKKISIILSSLMLIILLTRCSGNNSVANDTSKGCYYRDFIKIYEGLYYDPATNNVYMWNGAYSINSATVPSPYYTADGEIYKYNPETKELEEPKKEEDTNDN